MLIDLNRFNLINNSLQQPIGEQLLRAFVERVRTCIRKPDLLTRLSSTEFILLVEGVKSPNALTGLAERILAVLEAPVEVADQLYYLSASVGLVFTDQTRQDASEVLRNLQLALEAAKQRPNSAYVCFEPALREQTLAKIELERELRQALDAGQFEVYYQPKYELSTGRMEGMEALLRWKHPIRGFISPSEFIPLAEETGVINRLGQWVLTEAARQISIWNSFPFVTSSTFTPLVMSVNLSPVQARQPNLVEQVAAILEETGVDPAWLQLEITESLLIEPLPPVQETLSRLKALGLKLAIDDFGTGYSSLSYLKHFSLDTLKIDRTFIAELSKDNESRAIVQTIIQLGQALKLKVVAEGVESIEELLHLKRLGCDFAQGYYFARPLPASDLAPLLQSKKNQVVNLIA